jgi:hypothetical protein
LRLPIMSAVTNSTSRSPRWPYLLTAAVIFPVCGLAAGALLAFDPLHHHGPVTTSRVVMSVAAGLGLTGLGLAVSQVAIQRPSEPLAGWPRMCPRHIFRLRRWSVMTVACVALLVPVVAVLRVPQLELSAAMSGTLDGCYVLGLVSTACFQRK